jgi:DNA-binding Lrp family transcriptional regulator
MQLMDGMCDARPSISIAKPPICRLALGSSPKESRRMPMDDADRSLLAHLRQNARASTAALARALGLSRTTVQSRIAKLEREKVITGYTVRTSETHERGQIRALLMITLGPKQSPSVEAAIRRMADVRALHSVSGAFDMIAEAVTPSIGDMDALIDRIGALEGVERTTSSIILSTKIDR